MRECVNRCELHAERIAERIPEGALAKFEVDPDVGESLSAHCCMRSRKARQGRPKTIKIGSFDCQSPVVSAARHRAPPVTLEIGTSLTSNQHLNSSGCANQG